MTDPDPPSLPPAPFAPAPPPAVEAWQQRLEVVAILLLTTVALTIVARLAGAYDQARVAHTFSSDSIDLVAVVRLAGQQVGPIAAGAVLLAFLLVTLGPGDLVSERGVLVLRAATVLGLVVAGVAAFAGLALVLDAATVSKYLESASSTERGLLVRLSAGGPLLVAAAIAGYVAWCAFSTLGELPPSHVTAGPVPDEHGSDFGAAAEGDGD